MEPTDLKNNKKKQQKTPPKHGVSELHMPKGQAGQKKEMSSAICKRGK